MHQKGPEQKGVFFIANVLSKFKKKKKVSSLSATPTCSPPHPLLLSKTFTTDESFISPVVSARVSVDSTVFLDRYGGQRSDLASV